MPVPEPLVPIGEVVTTHGLDGWLKFKPFNPETSTLASARCLFLERDGLRSAHELEASKPYKAQFLIKLRDVDGIAAAEKWVGSRVYVQEESLDSLKPGEYYHYQAIGFEVFDLKGNRIGVITRTWSTTGADLYVVQGATREHLIPAVKDIIEKVDFTRGTMIINPPEGLLDL
jgi:16S rRNA processing protein RimM